MADTWPGSLPQEMLLRHSEGFPRNTTAFKPMLGAPLLFQAGDTRSRDIEGEMRISDAQRVTFMGFFEDTLRMGSRRFMLTSSSFDGETWLLQFSDDTPFILSAMPRGWLLRLRLVMVRRLA